MHYLSLANLERRWISRILRLYEAARDGNIPDVYTSVALHVRPGRPQCCGILGDRPRQPSLSSYFFHKSIERRYTARRKTTRKSRSAKHPEGDHHSPGVFIDRVWSPVLVWNATSR